MWGRGTGAGSATSSAGRRRRNPTHTANFGAAEEFGVEPEKVQGTLVAIAPVVGTARIAEAAVAIATALNVEIPLNGMAR